MNKPKIQADEKLKALKITYTYAEYKTRHAGDLDGDLAHWAGNIGHYIEIKKGKKQRTAR